MNLFKKSNQNLYLSTLNKYNSTTSIFKKKIKNLKNKVLISNSTTTIPILKTNSSFSNKNLLNKKPIINNNQENDIKTVKNLTLWDKENLNNSNENFNILYSKLNELYIKTLYLSIFLAKYDITNLVKNLFNKKPLKLHNLKNFSGKFKFKINILLLNFSGNIFNLTF